MIVADPRQALQNLRQAASQTEIKEISLGEYARHSGGRNSGHAFVSPSNVLVTQEVSRLNNWEFSASAIDRLDALVSSLSPHKRAGYVDSWYAALIASIASNSECTGREVMKRFNKSEFRGSDFRTAPVLAEDFVAKAQEFLRRHGFSNHAKKFVERVANARDKAYQQTEQKLAAFHEYRLQLALIDKIDDQAFLKKFVEQSRGSQFGGSTPVSHAVRRIDDQAWLCSIAVDGSYDHIIRIEAAKATYDLNLLQTAIQSGIEKLSQYSRLPEALYDDKDILDRLIGRYVMLANEQADLVTLKAIIGYPYNSNHRKAPIKLLTEEQLSDIVAELRDPQSAMSCSLKVDSRWNSYSDVAYAALCRLRLLKTGRQLDIPVDVEPDTIEKMWRDSGRESDYLPVAPLNTIAEAAQRMRDGLRMSEFWRENHLKDALELAKQELGQLLEKTSRGDSLNEYQTTWLRAHDQIMESYEAERARLNLAPIC